VSELFFFSVQGGGVGFFGNFFAHPGHPFLFKALLAKKVPKKRGRPRRGRTLKKNNSDTYAAFRKCLYLDAFALGDDPAGARERPRRASREALAQV